MADLASAGPKVKAARVSKLKAIELICERDRRPGDDGRSCKDRARHLIDSAIHRGDLRFDLRDRIALGAFVTWARTKSHLRHLFVDFPPEPNDTALAANVSVKTRVTAELSTSNLDECRAELAQAKALVRAQSERIQALEAEIQSLRPAAEKYQSMRDRNAASAQMPRKPRGNRSHL